MTDTVPGLGPCGVRWLDRLLAAGGSKRLWSYFFAHPSQESIVPGTGPGGVFVPHASEIVYETDEDFLRDRAYIVEAFAPLVETCHAVPRAVSRAVPEPVSSPAFWPRRASDLEL